jgi:hypothetical protein
MSDVRIELVSGLPVREVEQRIAAALEAEGVCKRVQAFFLRDLKVRRAYQSLGFTSVAHYARVRHGMSRRRVNELLLAGEQLEDMQEIDDAYLRGELSWSQVKQLLRVARVSNQDEWIARAKELKTVLPLRKAVDQARAGRVPRGGEGRGLPEPTYELRITMNQEQYDHFEQVREGMMRKEGRAVTESEVVVTVLGERAPEQFDEEKDAAREAAAEDKATPAWLREKVMARDNHQCVSCGDTGKHVHHIVFREAGGRTCAHNLTTICLSCHGLVHSGLLQVRGEAPEALRFLDRFGQPRDRAIAPVLDVLTRPPREEQPGEHAPGFPYLYSADDIPRDFPPEWFPDKHPQIRFSDSLELQFIPLEESLR